MDRQYWTESAAYCAFSELKDSIFEHKNYANQRAAQQDKAPIDFIEAKIES